MHTLHGLHPVGLLGPRCRAGDAHMDAITTLCAAEGWLELRLDPTNPYQWCRCRCISATAPVFLGAAGLERVGTYLIAGLISDVTIGSSRGTCAGYTVVHVLSLAETSTSLLLALDGETRILLWVAAGGEIITRLHLPPTQCREWAAHLAAVLMQSLPPLDGAIIRALAGGPCSASESCCRRSPPP